jgi:hypothetical protein
MKKLVNIETGKLNEFGNFYQDVDFQNQGSQEAYVLIEKELSEEIEEIKDSPEFWWSEFVNHSDNETYVIAADGELTSSGMYVVAKIKEDTIITTTALKTQNNNYLFELPDSYYFDAVYIDENGEFLRFAGAKEFAYFNNLSKFPKKELIAGHYRKSRAKKTREWIPESYIHVHNLERVNIDIDLSQIPSPIITDDYEVSSVTIDEDYSNYSFDRCRNGGDYGFSAEQVTILYNGKAYTYKIECTTAEIPYNQGTGQFDQQATPAPVCTYDENGRMVIFDNLYVDCQVDYFTI